MNNNSPDNSDPSAECQPQIGKKRFFLLLFAIAVLLILLASRCSHTDKATDKSGSTEVPLSLKSPSASEPAQSKPAQSVKAVKGNETQPVATHPVKPEPINYVVRKGDSLSAIFNQLDVSQQSMYKVLEADQNLLALDTLQPGNSLKFWLNKQKELEKIELYFNPAHQVIYSLDKDGYFHYDEINKPGRWQTFTLSGVINGSFYKSAADAGLNSVEISRVESLFKNKVNFAKDIRSGDQFYVVRKEQYIDGVATGNSDILGVKLVNHHHTYMAFMADDGNYYDEYGHSLEQAFLRYPTKIHYRISSPFNLHRLNPVTHRWMPHYGVDLAMPVGTPILATGDGIVKLVVANNPFAGKYIVVQNSNKYMTRFLHLSKALVHKGEKVSRGQVIALSGNTGRTTGPHLHYEFHINGKPVNPMTAKIPLDKPIPVAEKARFLKEVNTRLAMMDRLPDSTVVASKAANSDS